MESCSIHPPDEVKLMARIMREGRITIPKDLREKLGLEHGDFIKLTLTKVEP
jgi:AbrB family looped-hinge helix DNA binding protein